MCEQLGLFFVWQFDPVAFKFLLRILSDIFDIESFLCHKLFNSFINLICSITTCLCILAYCYLSINDDK